MLTQIGPHLQRKKTKTQVGTQVNSFMCKKFDRAFSVRIQKQNTKFPVGNIHENENLADHMKYEILKKAILIISEGTQHSCREGKLAFFKVANFKKMKVEHTECSWPNYLSTILKIQTSR